MKKRDSARGFSLIELVMVISVMMILAGISVPFIQNTLAILRLNSAVEAIAGGINTTRYQAIMHGYPYTIAINPAKVSYQVANAVPPALTFSNVGSPTPISGIGGIVINPATTLEFKPNGIVLPTVGNMSFTVSYAGRTKTITVSGVGRVQVQ